MDRSTFPEGVEVHQIDLQRTEQTKIQNVLIRQTESAVMGIVSGFQVALNASDNTKVDVFTGEAYAPNGEHIIGTQIQRGVALYSYVNTTVNYIVAVYVEVAGAPEPHEVNGSLQTTRSIGSYKITSYDVAAYNLLPATSTTSITDAAGNIITTTNYATDALDRITILASVTAAGAGVNLSPTAISSPPPFNSAISEAPNTPYIGMLITFVDHTTPTGEAAIQLTLSGTTYQVSFQAPGDATFGTAVAVTEDGFYNVVSPSSHTITVQITYLQLPNPVTTSPVYVTFTNIYTQAIPRYSPEDFQHRSMLGTGVPTVNNPHGLSLADIGGNGESALAVHEITEHVNGILPTSASTLLASYVYRVPAGPDELQLTDFLIGDVAMVNGVRVGELISPTQAFPFGRVTAGGNSGPGMGAPPGLTSTVPAIFFTDGSSANYPGSPTTVPGPTHELFSIFLDPFGNLNRVKRATLYSPIPPSVYGTLTQTSAMQQWLQIVGCSDGLNTIGGTDKNIVIANGTDPSHNYIWVAFDTTQSLPWAGNGGTEPRAVAVSAVGEAAPTTTRYRLYASNEIDWIDIVWYRWAATTTSPFPTSTNTSYSENVRFYTPITTPSEMKICQVCWTGYDAGGHLGSGFDSGDSSYSGAAYQNPSPYHLFDTRVFGNLDADNVASDALTQINNADIIEGTGLVFDFDPDLMAANWPSDMPLYRGRQSNPYYWGRTFEGFYTEGTPAIFGTHTGTSIAATVFNYDDNMYSSVPEGNGTVAWNTDGSGNAYFVFSAPGEFTATISPTLPQFQATATELVGGVGLITIPSISGAYAVVINVTTQPTASSSGTFTVEFAFSSPFITWLSTIFSWSGNTITYPSFRVAYKGQIREIEGGTLTVPTPVSSGAVLTSQYLFVDSSNALKTSGTSYPTTNATIQRGSNPNTWGDTDVPTQLVTLGIVWCSTSAITAINQLPQPGWISGGQAQANVYNAGQSAATLAAASLLGPENTLVVVPGTPFLTWLLSRRMDTMTGVGKTLFGPDGTSIRTIGNLANPFSSNPILQFLGSSQYQGSIQTSGSGATASMELFTGTEANPALTLTGLSANVRSALSVGAGTPLPLAGQIRTSDSIGAGMTPEGTTAGSANLAGSLGVGVAAPLGNGLAYIFGSIGVGVSPVSATGNAQLATSLGVGTAPSNTVGRVDAAAGGKFVTTTTKAALAIGSAAVPSAGVEGDLYVDSTSHLLNEYSGITSSFTPIPQTIAYSGLINGITDASPVTVLSLANVPAGAYQLNLWIGNSGSPTNAPIVTVSYSGVNPTSSVAFPIGGGINNISKYLWTMTYPFYQSASATVALTVEAYTSSGDTLAAIAYLIKIA
jgi:hypothetical protein